MVDRAFTTRFAADWIEAWNHRDLDRVLSHYSDDFEFTSELIVTVMSEPSGRLKGKPAIRDYWEKALARLPVLRFELIDVLTGVDSLAIYYRRHDGNLALEHFEFGPDGKVVRSSAHYRDPR